MITEVAEAEFRRLSQGIERDIVARNVRGALAELAKLQRGESPDYNSPWVALFYLTWYQPGQVSLAYRMLGLVGEGGRGNRLVEHRNRRLHIKDFGSGALAMQFAVALTMEQALVEGWMVEPVRIDSYDVSHAMIELGVQVWERLTSEGNGTPNSAILRRISRELLDPHYFAGEGEIYKAHRPSILAKDDGLERERWFSAVHAVYEETLDPTKESLSRVAALFEPAVGLFSCHRRFRPLLDKAVPLDTNTHRCHKSLITPTTEAGLPSVTEWRRQIDQELKLNHRYLRNEVTWRFNPASSRIFIRRDR